MPEQVRHSRRPDPAFAEMGVPVMPGSEVGGGVVQVDHHQPIEPEQAVELGQEAVDLGRIPDVVTGAPQVGGIQAETDPTVQASGQGRLEDRGQLFHAAPDPVTAARRVLDDDERRTGPFRRLGQGPDQAFDQPGDAGVHARATMRAGVDVYEPGSKRRGLDR